MAEHSLTQDAWTRARDRFVEDLTEVEKQIYYKGSLEMIYYDASTAPKRHKEASTSSHLVDKLQPVVFAIDQYAEALDVYVNAYPLALSPLWGSLRVVLHVSSLVFTASDRTSYASLRSSLENSKSTSKSSWTCSNELATCFLDSRPMSDFSRTMNASSN